MGDEKKILLTGGGTAGSVMPLLAIVDALQASGYKLQDLKFLFLGTLYGPERQMVEKMRMEFKWIYGGKLRRYFSWRNFIDPFLIFIGFIEAFFILFKWRPNLVISAGSFISVPVVWSAWLLGIPVIVHQQDIRPGLANKLSAPFAKVITVTFEKSLKDYGGKAVWTGNPIRRSLKLATRNSQLATQNTFGLRKDLPVVLIMGGGTGAEFINKTVEESLNELTKFCQIIHITGKDKISNFKFQISNYTKFDFLDVDKMAEAYALADVVVSRAGMGALTELSYLSKPVILIPIPDSHQEENAALFKQKNAALVLSQKELTPLALVENIKKLIEDESLKGKLSKNIGEIMKRGVSEELAKIIRSILDK